MTCLAARLGRARSAPDGACAPAQGPRLNRTGIVALGSGHKVGKTYHGTAESFFMSQAAPAMDRQERLEIGEKLFVFGFLGVLLVEALFTVIAHGIAPTWMGLLLGIFATCYIAYLGQQIYAGYKSMMQVARFWAAFMLLLSIIALVALAAGGGQANLAERLGMPVLWMALIKTAAYAALLAIVFVPQSVKDFVVIKSGGEPALAKEEKPLAPSGLTVALAAEHKQAVGKLRAGLVSAGVVLLIAGVLRLLLSLGELNAHATRGFLALVEGLLLAGLGGLLMFPARALKLLENNSFDMAYLMNALEQLRAFFQRQVLLVLGLILSVALTIYLWVW